VAVTLAECCECDFAGAAVTSMNENAVCIEFRTSYLEISNEVYTVELSLTDASPLSVIRHDLPSFVPLQQLLTHSSSFAKEIACPQFVWAVYRYLHAFAARRQETVLAKVCISPLYMQDFLCVMLKC